MASTAEHMFEGESSVQDKNSWHEFLQNEEIYQQASAEPPAGPSRTPGVPSEDEVEVQTTAAAQAAVAVQAAQVAAAAVAQFSPSPPAPRKRGGPKRPVDESKRAAQNRRAQAAFRQRRDLKFRELSEQVSQLPDVQNMHIILSQRLAETQDLVVQLKAEQDALRQAVLALGGVPPPETPLPELTNVPLLLAQAQVQVHEAPNPDQETASALQGLIAAAIAAPRAHVSKSVVAGVTPSGTGA